MNFKNITLPIIDDNSNLQLLDISPTEEFYNRIKQINEIYKEIINTNATIINESSPNWNYLLKNCHGDKILKETIITKKEERLPSTKIKKVPNNDALWYLQSYHTEEENYTKILEKVVYSLDIEKLPYTPKFINSLFYLRPFKPTSTEEKLDLHKIVKFIESHNKKNSWFTQNELKLTQQELLELIKTLLDTLKIEDKSNYYNIQDISINLKGPTTNHNYLSLSRGPVTKAITPTTQIIIKEKDLKKVINYLIENNYIQYYKETKAGIMIQEHTNSELKLAQNNKRILDNELKPLKKSLIRKRR